MCELFGMSCQQPDRAHYSLSSFKDLSDENKDGWGLAFYRNGKAVVEKEAIKAKSSERFNKIIQNISSKIIVAHLRYATRGEVCTENCHPFKRTSFYRDWVFAHNGTIHNISQHQRSLGTTDSEQAFHGLIDDIESYMHQSEFHGLYPAVKYGIKRLFEKYSKNITFNFLLSDGSVLYAFNHNPNAPLYLSRREKDYGDAIVISTEKLQSRDFAGWRKIPRDKVVLISDGRILVVSDRFK